MTQLLVGYARVSTEEQDLTVQREALERLSLGGSVYDPNDAIGRLLFNVLAMVAELFGVARSTVYRAQQRAKAKSATSGN